MAGSTTLAAPDGRASSAGPGASCQPWRPHSARSTSRSPSPLLSRLTRKSMGHGQEPSLSVRKSVGSHQDVLMLTPPEVTGVSTTTITANKNGFDEDDVRRKEEAERDAAESEARARALQMTREEFEALPLAIQRKYFSTLERLRFSQTSGMVDGIYQHYDDITALNVKRRRPRQDRSASDQFARRLRRQSLRGLSHGSYDLLGVQNLHDWDRPVTREEQVALARNLRASVLLDAADEAFHGISQRASTSPCPDLEAATPALSRRNSMDSAESIRRDAESVQRQGSKRSSLYESFRWLDEEEDLDLRLFLDDYHANLREDLPVPTKERGPSFRRHLSISKIPFGRSSSISSRPETKEAAVPSQVAPPPTPPPRGSSPNVKQHARRRSRTLSLITLKAHGRQDSVTINPDAAHYQDPEARHKLRVYLASDQKFDEAIQFGFPSADPLGAPQTNEPSQEHLPRKRESRQKSADWGRLKTFLDDDDDDDEEDDDDEVDPAPSTFEDPASSPDPDSPKTPQLGERANFAAVRPMRVTTEPMPSLFHASRPSESYAQTTSSREMTLRMTLTRPDLRANEEQIYSWQPRTSSLYQPSRKSQSELNMLAPKESMDQTFAGIDHWGTETPDRGVMKRFWQKVRRG